MVLPVLERELPLSQPLVVRPDVEFDGLPLGIREGAGDEKLVGTASGDGGVRLWDWSDVSDSVAPCVRHIRAHDGAEVNDVAFQDGGGARWLVTASDDGTARVYDVATGKLDEVFPA